MSRNIPDDNLLYPVLVLLVSSSGSGFFLNAKSGTFLVTAKHVLCKPSGDLISGSAKLIAYSGSKFSKYELILDLTKLKSNGDIQTHQSSDVVVVRVATVVQSGPGRTVENVDGVRFGVIPEFGITGLSLENCRMYSETFISNDVYIFGFPNSIGLPGKDSHDKERPLVRRGILSGKK